MEDYADKLFIEDIDLKGKKVLIRVDFNTPINEDMDIRDRGRIVACLPTIRYVLDNGGKAILMSHLGRPKGKRVNKLSLNPAAFELSKLLNQSVYLAPDSIGPSVEKLIDALDDGDVVLLENLRFHPEETENDPYFAHSLAKLGDVYVNDAFGAAHRAHASISGITGYIDVSTIGYLMRMELRYMGKILVDPQKPFAAILGGAKVSDKIKVIENLLNYVKILLIGGGMACTFFKALGYDVGDSLLEENSIPLTKKIFELAKEKNVNLILPEDCVIAKKIELNVPTQVIDPRKGVPKGWKILDIGPKTIEKFGEAIAQAKTVFWNGPMGVFEIKTFDKGTLGVAEIMAQATSRGTVTVIGGGDSAAAIHQAGMQKKMTHISTGGGALLEFLEGKVLPGVKAIPSRKEYLMN